QGAVPAPDERGDLESDHHAASPCQGRRRCGCRRNEGGDGEDRQHPRRFAEWLWSDAERKVAVEREYNEVRNAYATPKFDGSFLSFEGMALSLGSGPFDLRDHQRNAIWRGLVMRKSINAHEVGTGKTFTMGGIAVESRRYGIAKKPLLLAHNANSASVAAEIQMMYPAAKVLYVDNLSPATVDVKLRQIANDDWGCRGAASFPDGSPDVPEGHADGIGSGRDRPARGGRARGRQR
ncbi:hypothetical protein, partial [Stenotrophomonas sp. NRRL B-14846]|uniref:hypothetical protein n=1 Tax=Stenotrophomonas sp. NRRL B-14846 TaxID=3162882 RepID=UPI003D26D032